MLLKRFNTSFTEVKDKNKTNYFSSIIKYIKSPKKLSKRLLWEFNKYNIELDWKKRSREMGNSSVFEHNISEQQQKELTRIHEELIFRVLKDYVKTNMNLLDFGCGYGRFKKFFENKLSMNYFGVEKENFFLKNLDKKKFFDYENFKNSIKFDGFFDLIFLWAVLGGFNNKNLFNVVELLKKKLSKNGIICFVEIVSKTEKQGYWKFRTINYYQNLFKGFKINSDYYFIEDSIRKNFFLITKN
tara:strand:- start:33 stop:761 length:729 start_codon:yes stop_codon:yes gene_type:complete